MNGSSIKRGLRRGIRKIILTILPQPLLYEFWHLKTKRARRTNLDTATNFEVLELQANVTLEIYWSDVPGVGQGPSASLFVLDEEVLRLDCFGDTDGHMHFNPEQTYLTSERPSPRIYFQKASIPEQIERARFELVHNVRAAKASNMLNRVRKFRLKQDSIDQAAIEMTRQMQLLYQQYQD